MIKKLSVDKFLEEAKNNLIIDVRTPAEFEQGHITDAKNIPIFSNDERVLVGTCYKQQSREQAILLGFELVGGKWADFIRTAESLTTSKKIFVHCWRGGMRSGAMAWALSMYGFDVYLLECGYKSYRNFVLKSFEDEYPLIVLSGKTGSAKTEILHELRILGEQVIDLEDLTKHQGSAFGSRGIDNQPTQEQFENDLSNELKSLNVAQRIWVENESVVIGRRVVPRTFLFQMKNTQIIDIVLPIEERIDFLNKGYGILDKDFLKQAVLGIAKRLGPVQTQETILAIDENRMKDFIRNVLVYYDKTYQRSLEKRKEETVHKIEFEKIEFAENAKSILAFCNHLFKNKIEQFKVKHKLVEHE